MKKRVALFLVFTFWCILLFPHITASAAEDSSEIVMEVNSGRILYGSNIDERKPMASTTKILTALVIIEDCDLSEVVSIPREAVGVEGSSVYLKEGERFTVEDLLYGLMLRSGNDCSVALALHHSGSVETFAEVMNRRAVEMGANNSRFANPNGLPDDEHYTTARDLSLITCCALKNPVFQTIVSTKYYSPCGWKNKNKMLENFSGANGVKTGYTKRAGRCLVTSATREGMQLVCVILNRRDTYEETTRLLSDAFAAYSYEQVYKNEERTVPTEVSNKSARVIAEKDLYYPLLEEEKEWVDIVYELPERCPLPVKKGECLGNVKIYLANQLIFSQNLCTMEEVEKTYGDILNEISRSYILQYKNGI